MTTHAHSDDFDIAKGIFDQLKDLPIERQQRVLRWIAEGLGVTSTGYSAFPVQSASSSMPSPALPSTPNASAGATPTDIKSFITGKSPKSDNQFAAAVAYFYRFEAPPAQKRDSINGDTLQEATRLVGRNRLSNPSKTLNNAKAAGYLDGATPGEFAINSVGENLVAMTLPGGGDNSVKKKTAGKAKKKNAATKIKKKSTPKKK